MSRSDYRSKFSGPIALTADEYRGFLSDYADNFGNSRYCGSMKRAVFGCKIIPYIIIRNLALIMLQ